MDPFPKSQVGLIPVLEETEDLGGETQLQFSGVAWSRNLGPLGSNDTDIPAKKSGNSLDSFWRRISLWNKLWHQWVTTLAFRNAPWPLWSHASKFKSMKLWRGFIDFRQVVPCSSNLFFFRIFKKRWVDELWVLYFHVFHVLWKLKLGSTSYRLAWHLRSFRRPWPCGQVIRKPQGM